MPKANKIQAKQLKLGKKELYYVTRDIERASAGLILGFQNYQIITNPTPYALQLKTKYPKNITILTAEAGMLDTLDLLKHPQTQKIIKKGDNVLVFKNTLQIEKYCFEQNWKLLNPSAELANQVEEKISQIKWLGPLAKYLPRYKIDICQNIYWTGRKFILQFNRSHTGSGTFFITSKKQLEEIKNKFPNREVRIAEYIPGPLFTNNNIVWGNNILLGNISYQITGLKPFTDLPFATIGNDWALPYKILNAKQIKQYKKIATNVGQRLAKQGWKGLYGIDVIVNKKTGQLYLLEINARQPASTTFESELQEINKEQLTKSKSETAKLLLTTFEAHLSALLQNPYQNEKITSLTTGAQIIQRVTKETPTICQPRIAKPDNLQYILYNNTALNADLLRIQTDSNIMKAHDKFDLEGCRIIDFVICARHCNRWNAPRAGAILIQNKKVLLMKRNKYGKKYFTIPGGTLDEDKDMLALAKREIMEETGMNFEPTITEPIHLFNNGRDEYYFISNKIQGKAQLGGPEKEYNRPEYNYKLKWVKLADLKKTNLLPKQMKKIIYDLKKII